ncbi:hypothetical protein OCU04_001455 [Sclerotinia nivalis]|uniref:Peptidase C14 caspase domain-containing protein n=1 Tax=Sclerotinia nivalis TaxID=352851 RepID=A0A9X0AY67_9HELO|nr:hypothetical protein OCU04_001455 [Sclerotinia nivalis]
MAFNKANSLPKTVFDNMKTTQSAIVIPEKDYQDKEASEDSKLKAIWDEQISAKNASLAYREAHILLLSWHREDDDLHVQQEVDDLERVFRNTFKYQTTQKVLKQDPKKHPQTQINLFLAEFVHSHDDPNTLLIVYYAGHGKLIDGEDGLALIGSTAIPAKNNELHEIVWSSAEHNIQNTQSDVLVIFDCCNAGEMDRGVRGGDFTKRAFEYMAATSQRSTTKRPGPESFTTALIWALKEMVCFKPGRSFSTHELLRKICQAPNFPRPQAPRLTERGLIGSRRKIVLVPLDKQSKPKTTEEKSIAIMDEIMETINLRFVFNGKITEKMVREFAQAISKIISEGDFVASTVLWEGINTSSSTKKNLWDVVSHWRNHTKKRYRARDSISSVDVVEFSPVTPITPTVQQESSISSEESNIGTPNLFPSPAPEIGLDVGGRSGTDEVSDLPKKRKREDKTIHDSTSNFPSTPREKRSKRRQSADWKA